MFAVLKPLSAWRVPRVNGTLYVMRLQELDCRDRTAMKECLAWYSPCYASNGAMSGRSGPDVSSCR